MTSSTSRWSPSDSDRALRATRWAPAELKSEPSRSGSGASGHDLSSEADRGADPVEALKAEAYKSGFADGVRQESGKVEPAVDALHKAADEIRASHPAWIDNAEKNVLTLAIAVARQILGQELSTDPDAVQTLVSRALTRFPVEVPLTIRLHPSDLSRISAITLEGAGSDPASGRDVRWRADAHIGEGSCVVEGPERMVDGRVDKALLRIYQALVTDDQESGLNG